MPEAVLNVLVGEGTGQTLEDIEVEFPAPAVDIEVPDKQVEVTRCEVIPGKVIVVGRVIKSICLLREKRDRFSPRITLISRIIKPHMMPTYKCAPPSHFHVRIRVIRVIRGEKTFSCPPPG